MKYIDLLRNMGFRYVLYRAYLFFSIRFGFYQKRFPTKLAFQSYSSLYQWRLSDRFTQGGEVKLYAIDNKIIDNILNGYCLYFSKKWYFVGTEYDWVTNPVNGFTYDKTLHWTKIKDYSKQDGDIKYVWEPSRFTFLYDIIRYDQQNNTDHSEWIWSKIESWIDGNPINCGPNYKCSQEISLRILNWVYTLNYYRNSNSLTEERFQKIQNAIYWQMKHVFDNINFSRIAVRNNHAITETLSLYIIGSLFPFFKDSRKWKLKGKEWFEKEIIYQIYNDGTYLQFSHNYHRVVVQLMSWSFMIAEKNKDYFNQKVYERAYESLDFLYHAQDEQSGWLSNYGSNDGALFFPFTECDYRDYRPQLQTLHVFLTGKTLYQDGPWNADSFFMNAKLSTPTPFKPIIRRKGWSSYPEGGFYILREPSTVTIIKCGGYKDRPAQADNLHLDVWHDGKNILYDGGSYQYNTENSLIKYFSGTLSHNTVMLGDYDQMLKGARFIWYYWTRLQNVSVKETSESFIFEGKINAFRFLRNRISHKRIVIIYKNKLVWHITDIIDNKPVELQMKQLWHFNSNLKIISSITGNGNSIIPEKKNGFVSNYYGVKDEVVYFECSSTQPIIKTELSLL